MSFFVIELQKDALDQSISTTNLLRKALVVAKKLKLADFEKWINVELNGYYGTDNDIPKYRNVSGQLKGWNPYHGWLPTILNTDNNTEKLLTNRDVGDPLSEIEFLMRGESSELVMIYPANLEDILGKMFNSRTKYQLFVSKSQFQGILEEVRTTILKWSLELECDGILGDEMIFSEKEKEIAVTKNYTVNNFYGEVKNSQIQQHTMESGQNKFSS